MKRNPPFFFYPVLYFACLLFFVSYFCFSVYGREPEEVKPISSEGMELIEERLKSLSGSLEGMPEPPEFEGKLQIPDLGKYHEKKKTDEPENLKEKSL